MANPLSLVIRGVEEIGLRPTLDAVGYQIRLAWYRVRFGGGRQPLPDSPASYRRPGRVIAWDRAAQTVTVRCLDGVIVLTVLAPDVVRVQCRPASQGEQRPRSSYAVVRTDDAWPACPFDIVETDAALRIGTERVHCRIDKPSGALTFLDDRDRVVNADAAGMGWSSAGHVVCHKWIQPDERFYGLGERTSGLDRRGGRFENWNSDPQTYEIGQDPIYLCVPFLLGLHSDGQQGYGIFFDNPFRGRFDLGAHDPQVASFGARGGELCYTFIYGPALTAVLDRYTALTGRQALPPLWALGYHQSRWSYYPEERVRQLAADFRENYDVGCDAIHLDIHAMDGYRCFTWDGARFPDPAALIDDLHRRGFKVVAIADAGIKVDPTYWVYRDGLERGVFCALPDGRPFKGPVWPGNCVFPDFTAPRVRRWWGQLVERLVEVGVDGVWNDMNEPAIFGPEGTTMPDVVQHDLEGSGGHHGEAHNVYGMQMARATAEGLARARPDERPLVITRSGWAGVQRHAASWTADNQATWDQLRLTIPMVAGLGMSGVAFTGPDTGGFLGQPSAELFTRWLQLSVFLPLFRSHTYLHDPDQEPWSWGEPTLGINRRWIEYRYRLLPYLYTALWQSTQTGVPIVRPLVLAFQDQSELHGVEDQFMCGDHLLVAPVVEEGAAQRSVSLPAGPWYDVWRDQLLWGPARVDVDTPLECIPVFARAGAVIPTGPPIRYVGQAPRHPLTLHIYPPPGLAGCVDEKGNPDPMGWGLAPGVQGGGSAPALATELDTEGAGAKLRPTSDGRTSSSAGMSLGTSGKNPGWEGEPVDGETAARGTAQFVSFLYEDDGRTYAFREGGFLLTRFILSPMATGAPTLHLTRETDGDYLPDYDDLEIVVHGTTRLPDSVTADGRVLGQARVEECGRALRLRPGFFQDLQLSWD